MIVLLSTAMLIMDPQQRLYASRCLKKAIDLGLLDQQTQEAGRAIPTWEAYFHNEFKEEEDGFATVILGPVWAPGQAQFK